MRLDKQMIALVLVILLFIFVSQKKIHQSSLNDQTLLPLPSSHISTPIAPSSPLSTPTHTPLTSIPSEQPQPIPPTSLTSIAHQQNVALTTPVPSSTNTTTPTSNTSETIPNTPPPQLNTTTSIPATASISPTNTNNPILAATSAARSSSQSQNKKNPVSPPPKEIPTYYEYEVQYGDGLWKIIRQHYHLTSDKEINAMVAVVLEMNSELQGNPNFIMVGMKLKLPTLASLKKNNNPQQQQEQKNDKQIQKKFPTYHVVQSGETMYGLATLYYQNPGALEKILTANPHIEDPNQLPIGLGLIIP